MDYPNPPVEVVTALHEGIVIPAHPLALDDQRRFDERRQLALTRYYHAAGAGGLAVGVHSTQFEIRDPAHALFEPVLKLAIDEISALDAASGRKTVCIAGICGDTEQAVYEARFVQRSGYHLGLLSLAALAGADLKTLLQHCRRVAQEIPLIGFYLQPAAGGIILPYAFWQEFVTIPNVAAIKMAPFNRYQSMDVIRAVAGSERAGEIALYTGNDDHIILDLLSNHHIQTPAGEKSIRIKGGLLGHWACWTRRAVEQLALCKKVRQQQDIPARMLSLAVDVTDCNAAFFDAANQYQGAISGIHEVLCRQGLLANNYCLNPEQRLSPGQAAEIDRVYQAYPQLNDDEFVQQHLDDWLR